MYLCAQRVKSSTQEGINTFYYEHGGAVETRPPPPCDGRCGKLVNTLAMVEPIGGNDVLSYLDIVCDDGMPWDEIESALKTFVFRRARQRPNGFPWSDVTDCFRFELTMVRSIAQPGRSWFREFGRLYNACLMIYHPHHSTPPTRQSP